MRGQVLITRCRVVEETRLSHQQHKRRGVAAAPAVGRHVETFPLRKTNSKGLHARTPAGSTTTAGPEVNVQVKGAALSRSFCYPLLFVVFLKCIFAFYFLHTSWCCNKKKKRCLCSSDIKHASKRVKVYFSSDGGIPYFRCASDPPVLPPPQPPP